MIPQPPPEEDRGIEPNVLHPDEVVAHHWPAAAARGVLTNQRLLLLTHPQPIHRSVRWSVGLEAIEALEVEAVAGSGGRTGLGRGASGGARVSVDGVDPTFGVNVNQITVYIGDPDPCADLQRWIDEARATRCLALYGRLLPYRPGPPRHEDTDLSEQAGTSSGEGGGPADGLSGEFLLFVAGVPAKDLPGVARPMVAVSPGVVFPRLEKVGGHEAADFGPGQVYGDQAAIGRMVLTLAQECGVSVKVVDVDRSGADADLVRRFVSADDDLPVLVRPGGARLAGEESFTPPRVAEFLQGR